MIRVLMGVAMMASATMGRSPENSLDLIQVPHIGCPAVATPGSQIPILLQEPCRVTLVGPERSWELKPTWAHETEGASLGTLHLPPDVPEGVYGLEAQTPGKRDVELGCIWVRQAFPEAYLVAHIADPRVGSEEDTDLLRALIDRACRPIQPIESKEDSPPEAEAETGPAVALVLVTGSLTKNGAPDQWRLVEGVLESAKLPIFVCPGPQDHGYRAVFGDFSYGFRFGQDAFLALGGTPVQEDRSGMQNGWMHRFRRASMACRWTIGFACEYDVGMNMRAQLDLFVDDPLDVFIGAEPVDAAETAPSDSTEETTSPRGVVPWGSTRTVLTQRSLTRTLHLVRISPRSVENAEDISLE